MTDGWVWDGTSSDPYSEGLEYAIEHEVGMNGSFFQGVYPVELYPGQPPLFWIPFPPLPPPIPAFPVKRRISKTLNQSQG